MLQHINFKFVFKVVGTLCLSEILFLLICLGISVYYKGSDLLPFVYTIGVMAAVGSCFYLLGCRARMNNANRREGMLTVTLTWLILSLVGMLPFVFGGYTPSVTDAFFETMSGFTTTGATIFPEVESLPRGILFWRSIMQWQGGIGIVVFTVGLLPMLGAGSAVSQIYNAETTGIIHDRFLPRIRQVARRLCGVYILSTTVLILLLWLGPMGLFDAICHAFTCISTGGYSTRNGSIAEFQSSYIEYVTSFFMFYGSLSITLQYFLLVGKPGKLIRDEEMRTFVVLTLCAVLITTLWLLYRGEYPSLEENFRHALFQTYSIISTTGYTTADYFSWGPFFWSIAIVMMIVCGCAGSTTGGIKISRLVVLMKNLRNEFKKRTHPNLMVPVRINGIIITGQLVSQVLAFAFLYFLLIFCSIILLTLDGMDFVAAVGSAVSAMGNVGPGFGDYFGNFSQAGDFSKWILSFLMLTGRLEVFTVISILHPAFWRR